MAFDAKPDVEVFAMTALPDGDQSEDDADCDFIEDGGFNRLANEFRHYPDPDTTTSELFTKLTSRVNRCRELRASIEARRVHLLEGSHYCEIARREEAERQGESDGVMDLIRKIEEDAVRIEKSIPKRKERVEEIEREIEETKRLIALGAGWTEDQLAERVKLSDAFERARSEANEKNANLADLRSRLGSMEKEVEASIQQRDQSIEGLECVNARISEEQQKEQAVLLQCREAERSKSVLIETLRVAEIDLSDTRAEIDVKTRNLESCEREIENSRKTRESCSGEFEELRKGEDEVSKQLTMITSENGKIDAGNVIKRMQLDEASKEVHSLEKDRARTLKVRGLIDAKSAGTDKEREAVQKTVDSLAVSTSTLESTSIPLTRKEIEVRRREIKRQEQNFNLVNKKIGLSKKGSTRVADMIRANEDTLLSQKTELSVIKKAVEELQKEERALVIEEKCGEEHLNQMFEVLRRKHLSQKSQDEANRSLELAVTEAEKVIEQRRNECDNAREGHNAESKFLINLRGDLSAAKIELLTYTSQIKSMRDDVSRADDFVRKENSNRQAVDSERQHIETDIAAFHDKISRMNLTRNNNEGLIIQLGLEIDGVDQEREVLRKNYKTTTNKKDIASALLVAIKVEHNKVCRTVENMAGEMRGTMSRFHQLEESLESTKAMTIRLSDEKKRIQELIERKGKHNNDLVSLENDLAKQLFKNSALLVEIGRPINLHRWRFLREKAPQKFSTLESICNRQRQASQLTHRQASQEKAIERSEVALTKLRETISCHQSVDDMKSHLYGLKSEVNAMDTEIKVCEKELQERIVRAANLNKMIVSLEKKVVDMKTHYIVSVVENDNEYKD